MFPNVVLCVKLFVLENVDSCTLLLKKIANSNITISLFNIEMLDSVISLQEGFLQCPAQDNSSSSSSRLESPTPSTSEKSPPF